MLPIKKIYVDTRQRSPDSNSHSDFHIDLPTTILMPEDTGFYIEDICIPVSWWTIEENVNDYFFFQTMGSVSLVVITPGNYTTEELGTEIVKQMNSVFGATPRFASEYRKSQNAIVIKFLPAYIGNDNLQVFRILTDNDLKLTAWNLDRYLKRSINTLLKNYLDATDYTKARPFVSGFIDMNPVRNAYLTCSGMGNFSTLSLSGERNIVKKIPINGNPGDVIYDQSQTGVDHLDCSRQTLSRISFQLRDVFGRILDVHGIHWSFSIVFSRIQDGI